MNKHWWQSSTITGAAIAALSIVASPAVLSAIPAKYAWVGVVVGYVANQVGVRQAIAKNGNGN